ncbi:ABC transporter ATP-binding protein [Chondrinema litorale]|uniref:ABC transporter ATP-binding protein n=1 Tax=Chondrinema litorale TaxID=2994555 RepID=UPI002542C74E|nr:ABC transporter ATP-binding protein [Chondrinema litorale]UZR99022.1 ABC transporter ATP-binding protein [Chondrinema litorale]
MDSIIELKNISKSYGSFKAVDKLNLGIKKGEIFGLLGPNGAGKTTTILMILGLTEPTSGSIDVCGYNSTKEPIPVKKKVGYLPDSVNFYDNMTALENLIYIGKLNSIPQIELKELALRVLKMVGLEKAFYNKKTSTFSRGMKQRLGLAEVLMKRPEIIILDEPTLGIDPSGVKDFLALIYQLSREQGLTVLLSSHHLHQVQQVCDRVGIFVKGNLLTEGNINSLSNNLYNTEAYEVRITLQDKIIVPWQHEKELQMFKTVQKITIADNYVDVACSTDITPDIVRFFVDRGNDVIGVQKKEYGLEDIYQKYFDNHSKEHLGI